VTWSRAGRPVPLDDGRRIYRLASDGSLVVNVTGQPDRQAGASLGAAYTCHVTNGMTSDRKQVRLGYDVIGDVSDRPTLSWMSLDSVTGIQYDTFDLP